MADKRTQAAKRLAKKLTALRQTLRKDEREILDQLITKAEPEVQGHSVVEAVSGVQMQVVDACYSVVEQMA